jgi:hypothetical protein
MDCDTTDEEITAAEHWMAAGPPPGRSGCTCNYEGEDRCYMTCEPESVALIYFRSTPPGCKPVDHVNGEVGVVCNLCLHKTGLEQEEMETIELGTAKLTLGDASQDDPIPF